MRCPFHAFTAVLILSIGIVAGSTASPAQLPPAHTPSPAAEAAPKSASLPAPQPTAISANELQDVDVFGSDGQQVGKISKVNVISDGRVKDVEIRSDGWFGFFVKTYVVAADKLNKKGGRIELSMTSEQVKQLSK